MKKYQIIYADPPWSYNDKMAGHSFSLDHEYETQSLDWIKQMPLGLETDKDCTLFLWVVSPLLDEAFEVIKAWGFKYKTVAFVWSKRHASGVPVKNLGRWTMGNVEMCLLATKGHPQRVSKNVRQLVEDYRAEHSRKPDEVRRRIVELMGDVPRIELFARDKGDKDLWNRNRLDGWDAWGNEVESDIIIQTL
jgi:N6-adenosine-specific RNA methylase IME4